MTKALTICLWLGCLAAVAQSYEDRAVAAVLMGEAWSEGMRGMTAVAEVIQQRALEKRQTALQVVSTRRGRVHAFSCLNGTTLDELVKKFSAEKDFPTALALAGKVREGRSQFAAITQSATHFARAGERPAWARGLKPVAVIGKHAFYRLNAY
jgi:N-acetylmuramoyl-L-alanine amidase